MRRIMRAGVNAAWFRMVVTEVARGSFLHRGLLPCASRYGKLVQIDVSVWTVVGAEAAADTPVFDNHFQRIAPAYRTHRTAHHAQRIATLPAGGGNQVMVETQAIANEAGNAVVRVC